MRRSGADCGHDRGKVTDAHVKSAFLCLASCSFSAPVYLGADPDLNTDCLFFYSLCAHFPFPISNAPSADCIVYRMNQTTSSRRS